MKNKLKLVLLLITIGFSANIQDASGQCICNRWNFVNNTGCDIDLLAETPPPCAVTGALGKVLANNSLSLRPLCFATDCGLICPWAVRVVSSSFALGAGAPSGTVYYNVIPCASCPSGWIMATYTVLPTGDYQLIFDCQP